MADAMTDKQPLRSEFRCANCRGVFTKGWSEEEARAEAEANFGKMKPAEWAVVCDDCYFLMIGESPQPRNPPGRV